jgi:hypothetical protein
MKTEPTREEIEKDFSPEMMQFLVETLQTAVHEDHIVPERKTVDKPNSARTSK